MKFKPLYCEDRLRKKIINPEGDTGIVTLWTKSKIIEEDLANKLPDLFKKNSSLAVITNLYGNGLPEMLANLAYNPQISKIAIMGKDTPTFPSSKYLLNFLNKGTTDEEKEVSRIKDTSYYINNELKPSLFSHLEIRKFERNEHEELYKFVNKKPEKPKTNRLEIRLKDPEFRDFPSDITTHQINSNTPLEAWKEMVYKLERFGHETLIPKGKSYEKRRTLLDVNTIIKDPKFESKEMLEESGFDPRALREYQKEMLNNSAPKNAEYKYGNRLRRYWGKRDTLEDIAEILRKEPNNRFAFTSLWDPRKDLSQGKSSPCLTDIYFVKNPADKKLIAMASFRTHNATSAWLPNAYGIRAIQEYIASRSNLEPGQINIRSRYLSMNPDELKTTQSIEIANKRRKSKLDIYDPKGNYSIEANKEKNQITVNHYSQTGTLLEKIRGKDMYEIKNKLIKLDGFSSPDHAMWVGMELAKAQEKLNQDDQ